MFAYCGNNQVNGKDPTGRFNLLGFLGGVAVTVGGIFTAPYDGGVLLSTGLTTTYAAATDGVMVMDVSMTYGGQKDGGCVVIDFGENTVEAYGHYGVVASTDPTPSVSYSVGLVDNYNSFGDYSGDFVELDASLGPIGLSYCQDPNNSSGAKATCITFSTSPLGSASIGYDYYVPTGHWGNRKSQAFPSKTSKKVKTHHPHIISKNKSKRVDMVA